MRLLFAGSVEAPSEPCLLKKCSPYLYPALGTLPGAYVDSLYKAADLGPSRVIQRAKALSIKPDDWSSIS